MTYIVGPWVEESDQSVVSYLKPAGHINAAEVMSPRDRPSHEWLVATFILLIVLLLPPFFTLFPHFHPIAYTSPLTLIFLTCVACAVHAAYSYHYLLPPSNPHFIAAPPARPLK